MRKKIVAALVIAAILAPSPAMAEALHFASGLPGWSAVAFPGIAPARFTAVGEDTLDIAADTAAGMLWHALRGPAPQARTARWRWRVDEGVAATDLSRRGADDRSVGVYFVFGDRPAGPSAMDLLAAPSVTALVYVFGGGRPRGSVIESPHMGARGKFIVLRPAAAAKQTWFDETVDLAADYTRAFGNAMPPLIAVAVSTDSDDTRARNRARLQNLVIGE